MSPIDKSILFPNPTSTKHSISHLAPPLKFQVQAAAAVLQSSNATVPNRKERTYNAVIPNQLQMYPVFSVQNASVPNHETYSATSKLKTIKA
jgi:hypothetical protein